MSSYSACHTSSLAFTFTAITQASKLNFKYISRLNSTMQFTFNREDEHQVDLHSSLCSRRTYLRLTIFSKQRSSAVFLQTILVEIQAVKVPSSLNS